MKLEDRFYPYPVLTEARDDYTEKSFSSDINVTTVNKSYQIDATFQIDEPHIKHLIDFGRASFSLFIINEETRYRKIESTFQPKISLSIKSSMLNGKVTIIPIIVANSNIQNFESPNFNDDYKGYSFSIKKGNTLAIAQSIEFDAIQNNDDLKQVPSIFTVVKSMDKNLKTMQVDLMSPRIAIKLDKETFNTYNELRLNPSMARLLSTLIILPSLVYVLQTIFKVDSDLETNEFESLTWYKVIEAKLNSLNYSKGNWSNYEQDVMEIAQLLIGNPMQSSLEELKSTLINMESGD